MLLPHLNSFFVSILSYLSIHVLVFLMLCHIMIFSASHEAWKGCVSPPTVTLALNESLSRAQYKGQRLNAAVPWYGGHQAEVHTFSSKRGSTACI